MFQTLDTVVGVIFIFLLFGLVVSAAQEVVAAWLRLRSRALETGLNAMLENLGGPKLGRLDQLGRVGLPIGWTAEAAKGYATFWSGNLHVFGILLSAFAASLGAPFCFNVLQRFMNVRGLVKPPEPPAKPNVP